MSFLLHPSILGNVFSNIWWIYTLRFTKYFLKIFNKKHQTKTKDFKSDRTWTFKTLVYLFQIWKFWTEMEICRAHVSQISYCSINYSIFQIANSSFLQFQANLTSKNTELPVLRKPPSNPSFLDIMPATWHQVFDPFC